MSSYYDEHRTYPDTLVVMVDGSQIALTETYEGVSSAIEYAATDNPGMSKTRHVHFNERTPEGGSKAVTINARHVVSIHKPS